MHCTGPCHQGRQACPTPTACGAELGGGTYWPRELAREEEDKPIVSAEDAMEMPARWIFAVLAAFFIALMVWIMNADWPVMVGMLSL